MISMSLSMRRKTTSSEALLSPSKRQLVTLEDSSIIPYAKLGLLGPITLYASILVIAMSASEVIGAVVDEERIIWRNGCRMAGVSTFRMSVMLHSV